MKAEASSKSRCLFCRTSTGKRSREHIWRQALRHRLPAADSLSFWENSRSGSATYTRPISQFDLTLNAVCVECNSGWLSELEDAAEPVITFFTRGLGAVPDRAQMSDFAFWAVVRALLRTHYSSAGRAPEGMFSTIYELRDSRRVPDGNFVTIAQATPLSLEAGSHHSARVDGHYVGQVAVSWKSLLISIIVSEPSGPAADLAEMAASELARWFPGRLWSIAPEFAPPTTIHSQPLSAQEAMVAASALGLGLGMHPRDIFGNLVSFDGVVPLDRRRPLPWIATEVAS